MKNIKVNNFIPIEINTLSDAGNPFNAPSGRKKELNFISSLQYKDLWMCINWPYQISTIGYPLTYIHVNKKLIRSAATVSAMMHKPIENMEKHTAVRVCRNRACVNPNHIFWSNDKKEFNF